MSFGETIPGLRETTSGRLVRGLALAAFTAAAILASRQRYAGGYADGPSNPFGSGFTVDFHYSIYATYG
jgi:hypothetical protein